MKIEIFGLTITSSWGNGHATLWRGLCKALSRQGNDIEFFERNVPYYAAHRDLHEDGFGQVVLYEDWLSVKGKAAQSMRDADAVIVTSYCPDACMAADLAFEESRGIRVFYDLDTPVTIERLISGETVDYIGPSGLRDFNLVLSFTGGGALDELGERLGGRNVQPLYGHVDPDLHRPVQARRHYEAALSYLGTYARDRQAALENLLVAAAQKRPRSRFLIGGAQYPEDFPWSDNIYFVRHLPPAEHAAFFSSSRLTLNVTRQSMARMGWCPSGRLFEAAACGTAVVSDHWRGLEDFFRPGEELLVAHETEDVLAALDRDDADIARVAKAGRERVLDEHTSSHRARELCLMLENTSHHVQMPQRVEA